MSLFADIKLRVEDKSYLRELIWCYNIYICFHQNHPLSHSNWPHIPLCHAGRKPLQRSCESVWMVLRIGCDEYNCVLCSDGANSVVCGAASVWNAPRRFAWCGCWGVWAADANRYRTSASQCARGFHAGARGADVPSARRAYTLKYWSAARWVGGGWRRRRCSRARLWCLCALFADDNHDIPNQYHRVHKHLHTHTAQSRPGSAGHCARGAYVGWWGCLL